MPKFVTKIPVYEARNYVGGTASTTDLQGWLLSNNIDSEYIPGNGIEGDDWIPDKLVFDGKTLEAGQWAMLKDGEFVIMTSQFIYTQYTQTQ